MTKLARIVVEGDDAVPIVGVDGEIDAANAAELRRALREPLTNRATALVVDLTATRYLDSAGINLLFDLGAELRDRQQRLHVVAAPGSPIARMLLLTGFDAAEALHRTRAEALTAASR
jgi:anti-anti-sigma factor